MTRASADGLLLTVVVARAIFEMEDEYLISCGAFAKPTNEG